MSKHHLEGKRFEKLLVVHEDGKSKQGDVMWMCECDCGNYVSVRAASLVSGNTRSCGCIHKEMLSTMGRDSKLNLIGLRFGKLVVISETNEKTSCGHYKWFCRCDCGNEKLVSGSSLKSGSVKSCGCISKGVKYGRKKVNSKNIIELDLPLFDTYYKRLYCENTFLIREKGLNLLGVKCTYCGRGFRPTRVQVKNRILSLEGKTTAENRFYCSTGCKSACPTYRQVAYPKGFKKATSREVQPELRQMVLKRDNWVCQYGNCEKTIGDTELHCHHMEGIKQNPIESADVDVCITLCKKHHKQVHKEEGCRYIDLRCKEIGD